MVDTFEAISSYFELFERIDQSPCTTEAPFADKRERSFERLVPWFRMFRFWDKRRQGAQTGRFGPPTRDEYLEEDFEEKLSFTEA